MFFSDLRARLGPDSNGGGTPVAHRLVAAVWEAVVDGTLATGERLPTARELAVTLGVTPRSIERAYAELARLGVVSTRPGSGTVVSLTLPSQAEHARQRTFAAFCRDTVERAAEHGIDLDELIDALAEYRTARDESPLQDEAR
jgi:GntR family transcriptional regulator